MKIKHLAVGIVAALALSTVPAWSATVTDIAVPSAGMGKDIPAKVILPGIYQTQGRRLPVLYLLHGLGDDDQSWVSQTPIKQLADQYGVIVVCPDGGYASWYFDDPEKPAWRYETFVAKELVAHMDGHYRTVAKCESRAIAGQSMGGHGALFLAIRHPDTFHVVACLSGAVDLRPFPGKYEIANRLGSFKDHPDRWTANSVITLAETLPPDTLDICIECGWNDPFIGGNRSLHQLLLRRQVAHDYTERPADHDWDYWAVAIKYQMLFISDHLAR